MFLFKNIKNLCLGYSEGLALVFENVLQCLRPAG